MRLLIIEDEPLLSAELRNYFKLQGADCEVAESFQEAEQKILDAVFDMVLLDHGRCIYRSIYQGFQYTEQSTECRKEKYHR